MTTTSYSDTGSAAGLADLRAAHWLPRLAVAATFLYHGAIKFPGMAGQAEFMGLPLVVFALVALGELAAGAGLILGGALRTRLGDLATRASGVVVAVIMVGAIVLVHWGQWSNIPSESHPFGGMEFQTLLLAFGLYAAGRGNNI
ncbi:DoxX family protein [Histidinibacterium aquaticum]|uniref:DoxX family protein n=1 Tax=Histidinibacterium aquaticum TaxID=2613962 RepID=A0A5J5GAU2_9RHOB|nr:DoxX family protein [Histidinibacterium aquaticum]KAA9005229.1 DoxX family protein [Histidinibacterium aquaticum]